MARGASITTLSIATIVSTPQARELALSTDVWARRRRGCIQVEPPPACATACAPTPLQSRRHMACPLLAAEGALVGARDTLPTHSFGHGGGVVDMAPEELEAARGNASSFACVFRGSTRRPGGSELAFGYHLFISGLALRSITQVCTYHGPTDHVCTQCGYLLWPCRAYACCSHARHMVAVAMPGYILTVAILTTILFLPAGPVGLECRWPQPRELASRDPSME